MYHVIPVTQSRSHVHGTVVRISDIVMSLSSTRVASCDWPVHLYVRLCVTLYLCWKMEKRIFVKIYLKLSYLELW